MDATYYALSAATTIPFILYLMNLIKPFIEARVPGNSPYHDATIQLTGLVLGALGNAFLYLSTQAHISLPGTLAALGAGFTGALLASHAYNNSVSSSARSGNASAEVGFGTAGASLPSPVFYGTSSSYSTPISPLHANGGIKQAVDLQPPTLGLTNITASERAPVAADPAPVTPPTEAAPLV